MEPFKSAAQQLLNEVTGTLSTVDQGEFQSLVNDLLSAPAIVVAGEGRSAFILQAFARRLALLGRKVSVQGEAVARRAQKGDLLIAAGYGRGRNLVCALAEQARKRGVKVFALVAEPSAVLASHADRTITLAPSARTPFSMVQNPAQASLLTFDEALLILLDVVLVTLHDLLKVDPETVAEHVEED